MVRDDDPIYKQMLDTIEIARAHGIIPSAIHSTPLGIPIVESADVPKGTLMILPPKRKRWACEMTPRWDDESRRTVFVVNIKRE
jgi:hypothetical protein